jgi:hypothetical protein
MTLNTLKELTDVDSHIHSSDLKVAAEEWINWIESSRELLDVKDALLKKWIQHFFNLEEEKE